MARMIPSVISPETKSGAERKIFKWFEKAEDTDDWVVFHSLGIAQHQTLIEGEVDFLVVAPKLGIFALEVKGGRIKRTNGMWTFTNRCGHVDTKSRGPFDQAKDAIHSIMDAIKAKADVEHYNVANLHYGYGVMVPDIEYSSMGIDEEPWQVFDCNDNENVHDFIVRIAEGSRKKFEDTYGKLNPSKLPTAQDVKYLISILRSDFDKVLAIKARINNAEQELIELTEKQYKCLDQIEENRRGVVYGPAGTGKTLLAIEQAKKSVSSGKKVALLCFNNSIGTWFQTFFEEQAIEYKPGYVGTFHKLLLDIVSDAGENLTIPSDQESKRVFYREILPSKALEILLDNPLEFDEIILDEAQDLMEDAYLDIFDLLIKKGLEHGSWKFFGDYSRQAIYSNELDGKEMLEHLEDRTSFIRYKLTENCRNTKQICDDIQTVTGYEAPKDLWTKVEGLPVDHKTYFSEEEELDKLMQLLNELEDKNIEREKITILSPRRRENSIISRVENIIIKDYNFKSSDNISFSTVQSFKGLENSVVILVDINSYSAVNLMYVALSRARTALYIFETKIAHTEYTDLLKRRLLNG